MQHSTHHMTQTSLMCYFPSWSESEFNQKFRNKTRIQIIKLLQENPEGLTDTEMGKLIGCYPDLNINRPRRNDLSRDKDNRFNRVVVDSGRTKVNTQGNRETIWILNPERLYAYMAR